MSRAIRLARKAEQENEVPVGAIVVDPSGRVIGRGYNRRQTRQNVIEHAELMAIQMACRKLHSWRLEDCSLYVTLEPCVMCSGAIIQSRIKSVYFGAYDPKAGAVASVTRLFDIPQWNHHPDWTGGILEQECSDLLKNFFRRRRQEKKKLRQLQMAQISKQPETEADSSLLSAHSCNSYDQSLSEQMSDCVCDCLSCQSEPERTDETFTRKGEC